MKVIYVDDEKVQLKNFKLITKGMEEIESLQLFSDSREALQWVQNHPVDIAFLDIEMPYINGLELAKKLKSIDRKICVVFVSAYDQYTLDAFGTRASGYLLKPYTRAEIEAELENASFLMGGSQKKKLCITTMPDFLVTVNGKNLFNGHSKQEELFALLVDRGKIGITKGDALGCLGDGKLLKDSTYWSWMFRLKSELEEAGEPDLILTNGNIKYLDVEKVDCDLYRMQNGDKDVIDKYNGRYMERYAWAEERIAELDQIKKHFS